MSMICLAPGTARNAEGRFATLYNSGIIPGVEQLDVPCLMGARGN